MPWYRYAARFVVAALSFAVVAAGLLWATAAVALSIDWDIPEGTDIPGPSSVFDRDGRAIYRFAAEVERRPVPLAQISPNLQQAVIATEDHRFYEHQGVDAISVIRAVVSNLRYGGIREGGSTLTQQYVKNVYVGADRTIYRKIREAVVALQLEKERTKEEILEAYLNRVYFGGGAYGAEAAALTFFDKPAAELTVAEAATLASGLTAPTRFSPRGDPEGAVERRNVVIDEMALHGFISEAEATAAEAAPLGVAPRREGPRPVPYFIEEVRAQLLAAYGDEALYNGGLLVTVTLDLEIQANLEAEVAPHLPDDPDYDAGVVALDPATGDVLAAWSGRSFAASEVDLALGRDFGRPSGSSFKPFVLATALEEGMTLDTVYPAPVAVQIGDWRPTGGGCGGACTLLEATVRSINTVFAQIGRDVGAADFAQMARRLGVRSGLRDDDLTQALGTASVTPLDMASAFGTFANDGVACPARVVREVRDPSGALLDPPDPRQPSAEELSAWAARLEAQGYQLGEEDLGRCYRAVAASVSRTVTQALEQAVARGTGRNARIGRPQAGKTGTTNDSRETWFVGYTPDLAVGVFFGARDEARPLVGLPGCARRTCFGGDIPAAIWRDVAAALLAGVPPTAFLAPGDDERISPDRRRLGPGMQRPAPPPATPATETPTATPGPTASPSPTATGTPEPPPDDGGILPPIIPPP